jgi:hypothetical protein
MDIKIDIKITNKPPFTLEEITLRDLEIACQQVLRDLYLKCEIHAKVEG